MFTESAIVRLKYLSQSDIKLSGANIQCVIEKNKHCRVVIDDALFQITSFSVSFA